MGLLNKKDEKINTKKTVKKYVSVILIPIFVKLLPLLLVVATVLTIVYSVTKTVSSRKTVDTIYEKFEIEDISDLVEIKGNDQDGYYLDFIDDIDKKIEKTIDYLNQTAEVKSGLDKDVLKKLIKAEMYTQFPDLGGNIGTSSGFQGAIDIIRITPNKEINSITNTSAGEENINEKTVNTIDSNVYKLAYISEDKFNEYKTSGQKDVLNYFTLDDKGNLITVSWETKDDGTFEFKDNSTINIKSSLQDLFMPYAYLMYFYTSSDYEDFSCDLADEVLKSKIIIAVEDNIKTSNIKNTIEEKKDSQLSEFSYDWTEKESTESTTEYCNAKVEIIYADAWCVKMTNKDFYKDELLNLSVGQSKNINLPGEVIDESSSSTSEEVLIEEGIDKKEEIVTYIDKDGKNKTKSITKEIPYKKYEHTITDYHNISNSYASGNQEKKPESKESVFIDLYNEHKMYNRLNEGILLNILEEDERTANLVSLTKYLIDTANGNKDDDKEYDFSNFSFVTYDNNDFNTIGTSSSSELLIRFIHTWEHSIPPPTNADGTKYIIEDDGSGNLAVGYGVDIYNSGYFPLFQEAGYQISIGAEVDKEFVDSIEQEIMSNNTKSVVALASGLGLTGYQTNALISRAYNCGTNGAIGVRNGKDFSQAYEAYWNEDTDDYFNDKDNQADFNHDLYINYMKDPTTSKGEYLPGLERRRKSEWTIFQTGYYDILGEWHSDISGGSIVEIAKVIHEYMEKNNYSYCVYGGNSYEECSKDNQTHGLNKTFEQSKTGYKHSCCATFVSWVLQEAGYISDSEHLDSANNLQTLLKSKGFEVINNEADLQAGDILSYDHHVEIYAGNNTIYNAGSGKAIRSSSPQKRTRKFNYALRAPK